MIKLTALFINRILSNLRKPHVLLLVLLIIALLGVIDYFSGFEISFSFFYLLPIGIATWYLGTRFAHALTGLSITIWLASNWLAGETFSNDAIHYWNAASLLIFFILVSLILSYLKTTLEQVTMLSRTDPLTGLLNSREFHRLAELEMLRASRNHHPITIAFLDMDNFKNINDRLGHQAGDKLLRSVATCIHSNLRRIDTLARLGGDEFALLLPETDRASAEKVIQKIQSNLLATHHGSEYSVTFSLGAVSLSDANISVDDALRLADKLMYEAKISGKNNFLVAANQGTGYKLSA